AAFADLDRHRAADDVARSEVLGVRSVALHEALALRVSQNAALTAHALRDQATGAVYAGRMELYELHVLQRQPGAQHHSAAVAGASVRRGAGEECAPVAASGQNRLVSAEAVQRSVGHVQRDDSAALAVLHDQIDREVLDEELRLVLQRLLIQ